MTLDADLSEKDWCQLLALLDDTIQFDIVRCGHDKWARMVDRKRNYMRVTEEIKKRLRELDELKENDQ